MSLATLVADLKLFMAATRATGDIAATDLGKVIDDYHTTTPAGAATALATTGASVDVAASAPPAAGQVLTATDATHATWQAPGGGGGGRVVALQSCVQLVPAGGGTYAVGQLYVDPAWATGKALRFCADARVTDAAETGTLTLWDLVADEAITGSLAFTGSLDFQHDSAVLTVGNGAGEVKLTARLYEVRASMSGVGIPTRYMATANIYLEVY